MSENTSIEWTDATWNPVRGCSIVSKGCTNCYAMRQAHRSSGHDGAYEGLTKLTKGGPVWTGEIRLVPQLLEQPLKWKRPRRIFVNSMSDLFHDAVPDSFIDEVLTTIKRCEVVNAGHVFQLLTKRPQRMRDFMTAVYGIPALSPMPNLWLGVSVEDQAAANERIPLLLQTPAAVRWISAEPLLGPIDLLEIARRQCIRVRDEAGQPIRGHWLDWVVAGGESGPGARPMHPDWARSLRDQCAAAGVAFFFKQWGAHLPGEMKRSEVTMVWQDGRRMYWGDHADIKYSESWLSNDAERLVISHRVAKKIAGRELDGRTHDEYPA